MAHKLIIQSNLHLKWNIAIKRVRDAPPVFCFPASAFNLGSNTGDAMPSTKTLAHSSNIEIFRMSTFGSQVDVIILTVDNGSNPSRDQIGPAQELLR